MQWVRKLQYALWKISLTPLAIVYRDVRYKYWYQYQHCGIGNIGIGQHRLYLNLISLLAKYCYWKNYDQVDCVAHHLVVQWAVKSTTRNVAGGLLPGRCGFFQAWMYDDTYLSLRTATTAAAPDCRRARRPQTYPSVTTDPAATRRQSYQYGWYHYERTIPATPAWTNIRPHKGR